MAEDIRTFLIAGGLSATCHVGDLHELPHSMVAVTPTPGLPSLKTYGGGIALEQVSIQVRCRATDYTTAQNLMSSADGILDGAIDQTLNGRRYHFIQGAQSPFYLELDANERQVFACNYDILRSAP